MMGLWLAVIAAIALIAFITVRSVRSARAYRLNGRGIEALRAGDLDEAERCFASLSKSSDLVAQFNLASVKARRGGFAEAAQQYESIGVRLESDKMPGKRLLASQVRLERARCLAITGNLEEVDRLIEEASTERDEQWLQRSTLPIAVVRCRQGRFAEALNILDGGWASCAESLPLSQRMWLPVLRAYASDAGRLDTPAIHNALAGIEELDHQYLATVATTWPHFQRFLERLPNREER